MPINIRKITSDRLDLMDAMLTVFGEAFNDVRTYTEKRPSKAYLQDLIAGDSFIALVALDNNEVVGGVAAYDLKKFEQERSEIYIYDLAVSPAYRRRGVATALIKGLKTIARERSAYVVFVQADIGVEDEPAIALYNKLGVREEVLHFDIPVEADAGRDTA